MDMSPKPHAVDVARATIKRHRADEARAVVSSMKPVELFNTQHAKQVLKTTLNGTCPPPPETPPAIARARPQVLYVALVAQHAPCGGAWVSWREVAYLTVFLGLPQTRASSSQAPWAAWYVPHSLGESITVAMAHAHGRKLTAGGVQMVCAAGWRGGGPAVRHHQSPHANCGP